MSEKVKEEKKEPITSRKEKLGWILLIIFGPGTIGTFVRIIVLVAENLDEILFVIQNFTRNTYQFLLQLMESHQFWYILLTFCSNWIIGAIIIVIGLMCAFMEN